MSTAAGKKGVTRTRYTTGGECWFVDGDGRWFRCRVVDANEKRVIIDTLTGLDANRTTPWAFPDGLEVRRGSMLYTRLRPASAREP